MLPNTSILWLFLFLKYSNYITVSWPHPSYIYKRPLILRSANRRTPRGGEILELATKLFHPCTSRVFYTVSIWFDCGSDKVEEHVWSGWNNKSIHFFTSFNFNSPRIYTWLSILFWNQFDHSILSIVRVLPSHFVNFAISLTWGLKFYYFFTLLLQLTYHVWRVANPNRSTTRENINVMSIRPRWHSTLLTSVIWVFTFLLSWALSTFPTKKLAKITKQKNWISSFPL